ncbi:hypothetical protein [Oleidesulfovibrio sp.]|uniref:hypothetical protein n=1 Tax=Oleidesulfovibrio sp. TaxID=2909707 RepID=UPI003A86A40D
MRAYKLFFTVAVCSFLGGVVGGWLSAQGVGEAIAETWEPKVKYYEHITADLLTVKQIYILNDEMNTVGAVGANKSQGGMIQLFSKSKPLFAGDSKFNGPMMTMSSIDEGSVFALYDTDLDPRIILETTNREPTMDFRYNNVPRLVLGTNHTVTKATGDTHKIKGSVYTFDAKSKVTGRLP